MAFLGGFDNSRFGSKQGGDAQAHNRKGGKGVQKTDYKEMMEKRIAEYKDKMMLEATSTGGFHLPGTDPNQSKELSEAAKAVIQQMAEKRAKKAAKKEAKKVQIRSRSVGNGKSTGHIDSNGRVFGLHNQMLFKIDPKTGAITNTMGMKVGKYNPNSSFSMFQLEKLLEKENGKKGWGGR